MNITYHRRTGLPTHGWNYDYEIRIDGNLVGYVWADRAGPSSGTSSHWRATDLDKNRIGSPFHSRFRDLKADLQTYFEANPDYPVGSDAEVEETLEPLERSDIWRCALCDGLFIGYGHNPAPFPGERACDICNDIKVLPARLLLTMEAINNG